MECLARGFVAQERTAVFGGKGEVNVNGRKGLGHGGKMAHYVCIFQSQRDCVLQPKVAESARPPWVTMRKWFQPQRGCGKYCVVRANEMVATTLRLDIFADDDPG